MIPRQDPILDRAILFASRGASAQVGENTLESFRLAQRLGATGIESDLVVTADDVAVLRRSVKAGGLRRKRVADVTRAELGTSAVALDELYESIDEPIAVLLHVLDPDAVEAAIQSATRHRALDRLWLVSSDVESLIAWRRRSELVRLVHSAAIGALDGGPERHAALLRKESIDGVLAERQEWSGGRIALYHRFRRCCLATDAVHERMAVMLLHIGLDGVSSTHPDRLVDAANEIARPDAPEFREQ